MIWQKQKQHKTNAFAHVLKNIHLAVFQATEFFWLETDGGGREQF